MRRLSGSIRGASSACAHGDCLSNVHLPAVNAQPFPLQCRMHMDGYLKPMASSDLVPTSSPRSDVYSSSQPNESHPSEVKPLTTGSHVDRVSGRPRRRARSAQTPGHTGARASRSRDLDQGRVDVSEKTSSVIKLGEALTRGSAAPTISTPVSHSTTAAIDSSDRALLQTNARACTRPNFQ
jgi:hypothetical protein